MHALNEKIIKLSEGHTNRTLFSLSAFLLFIGILLAILTLLNTIFGLLLHRAVPIRMVAKHLLYAAICILFGTLGIFLG